MAEYICKKKSTVKIDGQFIEISSVESFSYLCEVQQDWSQARLAVTLGISRIKQQIVLGIFHPIFSVMLSVTKMLLSTTHHYSSAA